MGSRRRKLLIVASALLLEEEEEERQPKTKKRSCWTMPWNSAEERRKNSFVFNLEPLLHQDDSSFRKYVRVTHSTYKMLLEKLTPLLKRQEVVRQGISPAERLSITLSHLAHGISQTRLAFEYRVAQCTVSHIIHDTVYAINHTFGSRYLSSPSNDEEWRKIAIDFYQNWDYPNCIGALDGKHINLFKPRNSGSSFHNYKNQFSIVLMALVDANYRFIYVDIGSSGRMSDGGVWEKCAMKSDIECNRIGLPGPAKLPGSQSETPFVILGDSAFGLKDCLMRPFPEKHILTEERIYNYRHCRARRVVENAFGILASRWRLLLSRMLYSPAKSTAIVKACCVLHNLLLENKDSTYNPPGLVDREEGGELIPGEWRQQRTGLVDLVEKIRVQSSQDARDVRNSFTTYFNHGDIVPWQNNRI